MFKLLIAFVIISTVLVGLWMLVKAYDLYIERKWKREADLDVARTNNPPSIK